jgi:uncharacterized membrane protein YqgA involved in biofilm formation
MVVPVASIINVVAIIIGGSIGVAINKSLDEKYKEVAFQALGLFSVILGISMSISMENPLAIVFSLILGGVVGTALKLGKRAESFGNFLKARLRSRDPRFTEGMVTAFLLYCVGTMAIVGSINEGVRGDMTLLLTKSTMDGIASIALASSLGSGVIFSVIPLFIYQAGITILASYFGNFFTPTIISYLTYTGGIMIVGVGIDVLKIKKISTVEFLPALLFAALFALLA